MKKILAAILCVSMALGLCACGEDKETSLPNNGNSTVSENRSDVTDGGTSKPESAPEPSEPVESSLGSVTILGEEYDIATTTTLSLNTKKITDEQLKEITPEICKLINLTKLELEYNKFIDISPLAALAGLPDLTSLSLANDAQRSGMQEKPMLSDLSPLSGLINLTELKLTGNHVSDLTPLVSLTNLTYLNLGRNRLTDITPLSELKNLKILDLYGNPQIGDPAPLADLTNLEELYLERVPISDLSTLSGLTGLKKLDLRQTHISDLTPLSSLTGLTNLGLRANQLSDVTPLGNLTNLTGLDLGENKISDITPLESLTGLTSLLLDDNNIGNKDVERLKEKLPNCTISLQPLL